GVQRHGRGRRRIRPERLRVRARSVSPGPPGRRRHRFRGPGAVADPCRARSLVGAVRGGVGRDAVPRARPALGSSCRSCAARDRGSLGPPLGRNRRSEPDRPVGPYYNVRGILTLLAGSPEWCWFTAWEASSPPLFRPVHQRGFAVTPSAAPAPSGTSGTSGEREEQAGNGAHVAATHHRASPPPERRGTLDPAPFH